MNHSVNAQLGHHLQSVYESLLPRTEQQEERLKLLQAKLQAIVDTAYPGIVVRFFGSSINNLGSRLSDVDVVLDVSGLEQGTEGEATTPPTVRQLAKLLHKRGRGGNITNIEAVTFAKVPIVKCYDPVLKFHIDLSIGNCLAVYNSFLIRTYTLLDPRVKPFIMILKHWIKRMGLNDASMGGMSSYALVLMAIHFMQQINILPSLQMLSARANIPPFYYSQNASLRQNGKGKKPPKKVAYDVSYLHDFAHPMLANYAQRTFTPSDVWFGWQSIPHLVFGFFEYYGCILPAKPAHIISVKAGGLLDTEEMSPNRQNQDHSDLLIVQDPFDTSRNCTGGFHKFATFQTLCRDGVHVLHDLGRFSADEVDTVLHQMIPLHAA